MTSARKLLFSVLLMTVASAGLAEQRKEARDGNVIEATISDHGPTRIRVAGQKITDVVGNIQSTSDCDMSVPDKPGQRSGPAANSDGDLVLSCDLQKGQVYVRPVQRTPEGKRRADEKPIDLFVSTERATYALSLTKKNAPADSIVLVDKTSTSADSAPINGGKSSDHVRSLKNMLRAMASGRFPSDLRVTETNQRRPLWAEAEFTLRRTLEGRGFVGDSYVLRNSSDATMVIAEQEFDADGVAAVSVENLNVRPNETTWVHIIRAGE